MLSVVSQFVGFLVLAARFDINLSASALYFILY